MQTGCVFNLKKYLVLINSQSLNNVPKLDESVVNTAFLFQWLMMVRSPQLMKHNLLSWQSMHWCSTESMLQLYLDIQSVNNQIIVETGLTMHVIIYLVMLVLVSQTLTSNVRLIKTVNYNLEKLNPLREYTTIMLDLPKPPPQKPKRQRPRSKPKKKRPRPKPKHKNRQRAKI